MEESKRSERETDQLYESPLWHYNFLTFTLEQLATQTSKEMRTSQDGGDEDVEEVSSVEEGTISLFHHSLLPR